MLALPLCEVGGPEFERALTLMLRGAEPRACGRHTKEGPIRLTDTSRTGVCGMLMPKVLRFGAHAMQPRCRKEELGDMKTVATPISGMLDPSIDSSGEFAGRQDVCLGHANTAPV
jgi:hypothetical protein